MSAEQPWALHALERCRAARAVLSLFGLGCKES